MDSRRTTTYLKGAAIATVMFSHFGGYYGDQDLAIFVNAVSLFFVLSGYGIYYSLDGYFQRSATKPRALAGFYISRAAKIFPLYWLALVAALYYNPDTYQMGGISWAMLGIMLVAPFLQSHGIFWFITAIFQCYLVAPLLYWAVKKLKPAIFLTVTLLLLGVSLGISYWIGSVSAYNSPWVEVYFYRELLLANIFLFSLGMAIPGLLAAYPGRFNKWWLGVASLAGFLSFVWLTWLPEGNHYLAVPLILFAFTLSLYAVAANPRLPLTPVFVLLGSYSFSLYLFHDAFFTLLKNKGLLLPPDFSGSLIDKLVAPAWTLLFFPVFVLVCILVEKAFAFWSREFMKQFFPQVRV
ncbi:MAG: acyltransferase family protein [Thermoleophilia bacterium]